jgi:hypothetical protein
MGWPAVGTYRPPGPRRVTKSRPSDHGVYVSMFAQPPERIQEPVGEQVVGVVDLGTRRVFADDARLILAGQGGRESGLTLKSLCGLSRPGHLTAVHGRGVQSQATYGVQQ